MNVSLNFPNLKIVAIHTTTTQNLVLLRKLAEKDMKISFDISNSVDNFDWLPKVQEIVAKQGKIVLYSQNEPLNGIIGFVNSLKLEIGASNIQCVFVYDKAPKYDEKLDFYSSQLEKGLVMNVWRNDKWGTYRHLLINDRLEVERPHRYISFTKPGVLTSAKWLEGPTYTEHAQKLLVNVYLLQEKTNLNI